MPMRQPIAMPIAFADPFTSRVCRMFSCSGDSGGAVMKRATHASITSPCTIAEQGRALVSERRR